MERSIVEDMSKSNSISGGGHRRAINPTPVGRGRFPPPYQKMAITPKNNDPKEPKLCDFSYISMTNPPVSFWELRMAKKGVL